MRIYISEDTNSIVADPNFLAPVSGLSFKRGDSAKIEIVFVTGNEANTPAPDRLVVFGIKESGKYDGDFLVTADDYTISGTSYVLTPSFNTTDLNDALNSGDANDGNDIASLTAMLEITWSDDEGGNWQSTATITATISNDVIKGVESAPSELPTPIDWIDEHRPLPLELSYAPVNAEFATINQVFDNNPPNDDTFVIAGGVVTETYTFKTSPTLSTHVQRGVDKEATLLNLQTVINAVSTLVSFEAIDTYQFTLTALTAGDSGNSIATSGTTYISTLGNLEGGVDGTEATILGQHAIVVENDVYFCVRVSPVKWVPLTLASI